MRVETAAILSACACILLSVRPAFADLKETGSSDVTQGITASSLTVTSSGTAVYSVTSATGIHLLNGKIKLESGAFIEWSDGSISTTAWVVSTSAWTTAAATFTRLANEMSTTNSVWTAAPGSTISLTMNGGHALAIFTCPAVTSSVATPIGMLVNGALVDGQTAGSGSTYGGLNSTRSTTGDMGGFVHMTESTFSGTTSFVVVFKSAGGNGTLNASASSICQFAVLEI